MRTLTAAAKHHLSPRAIVRLRVLSRRLGVPRWGNLRRRAPFSNDFGFDRGTPVDRYYLHRFLAAHAAAIAGDVLEIQMPAYTDRFGTHVRARDTVDVNPAFSPTYLCDLSTADLIPGDRYDCFLLPNTLSLLRDIHGCLRQMIRIVKPGGVVLAATPAYGPLAAEGHDYWRMGAAGWRELASEAWAGHDYRVEQHGNCVSAIAALLGLAHEELTERELDAQDDRYPVLVTLYCRKANESTR